MKNVIRTFFFFSTFEVDGEEKSLVKIHIVMHILKIFRIIPNQIGLSLNPFSEPASKLNNSERAVDALAVKEIQKTLITD